MNTEEAARIRKQGSHTSIPTERGRPKKFGLYSWSIYEYAAGAEICSLSVKAASIRRQRHFKDLQF
jgi:hypothetical protein